MTNTRTPDPVLAVLEAAQWKPWHANEGKSYDEKRDPNVLDLAHDAEGHNPIARGFWGGMDEMRAAAHAVNTFAAAREALRAMIDWHNRLDEPSGRLLPSGAVLKRAADINAAEAALAAMEDGESHSRPQGAAEFDEAPKS